MVGVELTMPRMRLRLWIGVVRCLRDERASVRLRSGKSAYV